MKKFILLVILLSALASVAQSTRPAVVTWTASTSTDVTGYAIFRCTVVAPATSCSPILTGAPLATVTSGLTFTDNPAIGSAYGYAIVAQAPACSLNSNLTAPCGNAPPAGPGNVPVPPVVDGAHSVVVVVP